MPSVYNDTLFNVGMQYGTSFGTSDLNGTTLKIAAVFRARGQQITKIGVNVSTVTSPPVYLADLQSVASAAPSATVLGGGSPASATFTPAAGWQWITLANPYTPALGDIVAAVIEYSSGTIDASHHAVFNLRIGNNATDLPVPMSYNGTVWSNNNTQFPLIAVQYSDGTVHQYMCGLTGLPSNIDFNSSSTPNEYGITFVAPGNITIDSLLVGVKPGGTFTGVVTVYDGGSNSLVGSDNVTVTQNETFGGSGIALSQVPLTPIALTAGSRYYIGWKPTTGNNIRAQKHVYESAAGKRAIFGDASFVSRKDSGAWTQDDASVCLMTPMISAVAGGTTLVIPGRPRISLTQQVRRVVRPFFGGSGTDRVIVARRQVQRAAQVVARTRFVPAPPAVAPLVVSRRANGREVPARVVVRRPVFVPVAGGSQFIPLPRRNRPYAVAVPVRRPPSGNAFLPPPVQQTLIQHVSKVR